MAANGWRAWLWRAHISWPIARRYMVGALLAPCAFMTVRLVMSKPMSFIILGCTLLITLLLPKNTSLSIDKPFHAMSCGLMSSVLQLSAGVSGPILNSFFVHSTLKKHGVVATKAITQSFGHMLKVAYFGDFLSIIAATHNQLTPVSTALWIIVCAIALAFAGTNLSRRVLDNLDEAKFRKVTRLVIIVIGAGYLITGLSLLYYS